MNLDNIFGLRINKRDKSKENEKRRSFVAPTSHEGATIVDSTVMGHTGGRSLYSLNLDADVSSEADLINVYRTISVYPEVDQAIEEIVNEMIVTDEKNLPVSVNLDSIDELDESTKKTIIEEFEYILSLLNFQNEGYDHVRRWYIDSRTAFQKIINTSRPRDGIIELRYMDPRRVRRVKEVIQSVGEDGITEFTVGDEYYVYYNEPYGYSSQYGGGWNITTQGRFGAGTEVLKLSLDSVAFASSGLVDPSSGMIYGYLQKTVKVFNQLRNMEDSAVIYRMVNSPERRVIYVDTGNMSGTKATQYIRSLQANYRNRQQYDAKTGSLRNENRVLAMQEDIWLPRKEGSKGTDIQPLQGAQNLGVTEDLQYFRDKLHRSLNVPLSRFSDETPSFFTGGTTEISRDELKFSKFIGRLRSRYNTLWSDILRTQLILKGIVSEDEWDQIEGRIFYDYVRDSFFAEAKDNDILSKRIEVLNFVDPFVGRYYSHEFVRKNVLHQTDEEIKQIDEQIAKESEMDQFKDPEVLAAEKEQEQAAKLSPPKPSLDSGSGSSKGSSSSSPKHEIVLKVDHGSSSKTEQD